MMDVEFIERVAFEQVRKYSVPCKHTALEVRRMNAEEVLQWATK